MNGIICITGITDITQQRFVFGIAFLFISSNGQLFRQKRELEKPQAYTGSRNGFTLALLVFLKDNNGKKSKWWNI